MADPEQFVGELMKCSLCDFEKRHVVGMGSGWLGGAVGIEGKEKHAYYLCPQCLQYAILHPHPKDPPEMREGLEPHKGIEHKPNRDYGLAFLTTYAMKCEVEMERASKGRPN